MEVGEKMEIKSIDFDTRMDLEDNISVKIHTDGSQEIIGAKGAVWDFCACAMFGKMKRDLTKEQKAELNKLSKDEAEALCARARVRYENPSQG